MIENLIGATTAVFPIRLSVAVTSPVDVEWATRDGSAVAGSDYKATAGTVTFLPGETEKQIEVQVYGQAITPADDKVFFIRLNPPSNAVLVDAILTCTINIIDDQGTPSVAVVIAEGRRGPKGDPGLSAYEQAVLMGYTGTVEQWMDEIADASQAASLAQDYSNTAAEEALKAQNAAKNAVFAGVVFPTAAEGVDPVLGVQNGAYFNVRSPLSEHYIDEYQNVNGVAVATGKSYPTSEHFQNISDHTALPYVVGKSYNLYQRVQLENGDIVKSTIPNNTTDPNFDIAGWVKKGNIITVDSVAEMLSINPENGMRVATKSYHLGLNKGGCSYYYDSSRVAENNGGSVINGWVALGDVNNVFQWGAKGDGVSNDSSSIQNAVDNKNKVYFSEGIYLCNVILSRWFNLRGDGKGTILKPFDIALPVITNINRQSLGWYNDTVFDLDIQSADATGIGFSYGVLPASNDYYGVGRVAMHNVRFIALNHGVRKVNGNIGNKYYNCSFEYCNYGVYATSNQVAIPGSTFIMHSGCDMYYSCNFSENNIAGAAYYDKTHGSGQWLFDNCTFQFNKGFGVFFDFVLPDHLFAPIVFLNCWFEENARSGNVTIDRVNGAPTTIAAKNKQVFGSNDVIVVGSGNYNTRFGVGVAEPQRTMHIHDADAAILQLTTAYTGNVDPNRGALAFFTYPDLILENKEGGRILLRSPFGDAEIDLAGNLVSRKAKIGYGKGAGNVVTQGVNKDWSVTCNTPSGRIITSAQSLAAGANISFILNNSYIEETDVLIANVRYSPSNSANYYDIKVINVNNGTCLVNIKNTHNIALAEAIHISFCIVKGAVDPVY